MINKIENYIRNRESVDWRLNNVMRDFAQGYKNIGEICWYYDYSIDLAVSHLKAAGVI